MTSGWSGHRTRMDEWIFTVFDISAWVLSFIKWMGFSIWIQPHVNISMFSLIWSDCLIWTACMPGGGSNVFSLTSMELSSMLILISNMYEKPFFSWRCFFGFWKLQWAVFKKKSVCVTLLFWEQTIKFYSPYTQHVCPLSSFLHLSFTKPLEKKILSKRLHHQTTLLMNLPQQSSPYGGILCFVYVVFISERIEQYMLGETFGNWYVLGFCMYWDIVRTPLCFGFVKYSNCFYLFLFFISN